ncbi:o-succinylbenzoate synthase [Oculatella sp. LEGE 06141]|uniref:o-succinylbenzoate synthase n=1 Tax=Oculatella sp. LEGE 06141 TaxID=1828648 RepID=UPI0030D8A582
MTVLLMRYGFEFRYYRRSFRQPLRTSHGLWNIREGIILKLTDEQGHIGLGEIAPIKLFGSESIRDALRFCRQLPGEIDASTLTAIPAALPACQFGFGSAWQLLTCPKPEPLEAPLSYSHLLPTGAAALQSWQPFWEQGDRTFKLKVGVASLKQELQQVEQLLYALPAGANVRLDANGGLNWNEACQWLQACDALNTATIPEARVEFIEQPLPPDQFEVMLKLNDQYETAIALDESVATIDQLEACYEQGWRGMVIVKAAIAGSPVRLQQFCQTANPDIVWSSVFETAIAQHFIKTRLIPSISRSSRAIGFGVRHWFADSALNQTNFEQLWQSL